MRRAPAARCAPPVATQAQGRTRARRSAARPVRSDAATADRSRMCRPGSISPAFRRAHRYRSPGALHAPPPLRAARRAGRANRSPIARSRRAMRVQAAALRVAPYAQAPAPTPAAWASCFAIKLRQCELPCRIDEHREERLAAPGPVFGSNAKDVDQDILVLGIAGEDEHVSVAFSPRQVAERIG